MKNYELEIYVFIQQVIPFLMESVEYAEVHYEEDAYGHIYELINGKMLENESRRIQYKENYEDNLWG